MRSPVAPACSGGFSAGPLTRLRGRIRGDSWLAVLALGAVAGLTGFCAGPILGAVLTVAAASGQTLRGGMLLAVYAAGMAAPLFVLAALWDRYDLGHRRWLRGRGFRVGPLRLHTTSLASGLLFIALGALFLVNGNTTLSRVPAPPTTWTDTLSDLALEVQVPDLAVIAILAATVTGIAIWQFRSPGRGSAVSPREANRGNEVERERL